MDFRPPNTNGNYINFVIAGGYPRLFYASANKMTSSATLTANTWHHVALTRDISTDPDTMRIYLDGVKTAQITENVDFLTGTDRPVIAGLGYNTGLTGYSFKGYIQDLRYSGKARYTLDDHSPSSSASVKIPDAPLKG